MSGAPLPTAAANGWRPFSRGMNSVSFSSPSLAEAKSSSSEHRTAVDPRIAGRVEPRHVLQRKLARKAVKIGAFSQKTVHRDHGIVPLPLQDAEPRPEPEQEISVESAAWTASLPSDFPSGAEHVVPASKGEHPPAGPAPHPPAPPVPHAPAPNALVPPPPPARGPPAAAGVRVNRHGSVSISIAPPQFRAAEEASWQPAPRDAAPGSKTLTLNIGTGADVIGDLGAISARDVRRVATVATEQLAEERQRADAADAEVARLHRLVAQLEFRLTQVQTPSKLQRQVEAMERTVAEETAARAKESASAVALQEAALQRSFAEKLRKVLTQSEKWQRTHSSALRREVEQARREEERHAARYARLHSSIVTRAVARKLRGSLERGFATWERCADRKKRARRVAAARDEERRACVRRVVVRVGNLVLSRAFTHWTATHKAIFEAEHARALAEMERLRAAAMRVATIVSVLYVTLHFTRILLTI